MFSVERAGTGSDYFVKLQTPMSFEDIVKNQGNIHDAHRNRVIDIRDSGGYCASINRKFEKNIPSKFIAFKCFHLSGNYYPRHGSRVMIFLSEKGSMLYIRWDVSDDCSRPSLDQNFGNYIAENYNYKVSKYENTKCNSITTNDTICSMLKHISYGFYDIGEALNDMKLLAEQTIHQKNQSYMLDKLMSNMDKTIKDTETMLNEL